MKSSALIPHLSLWMFIAVFFTFLGATLAPAPVFANNHDVIELPEIVVTAEAQGFVPLADVEGSKLGNLYDAGGEGGLSNFISRLFGFALSIGAILAILRIAWGGYLYMTTDLWSSKERAREVLRETVLGLLLLLAVWVILNQINPNILDLNLRITPAPSPPSTPAPANSNASISVPSGSAPVIIENPSGGGQLIIPPGTNLPSDCTTTSGQPGVLGESGTCFPLP